MPEIEIRPGNSADIPELMALEHGYTSDHVWQIDIQRGEGQVLASLRETRLPRSARVESPYRGQKLTDEWKQRAALLVATLEKRPVGYVSIRSDIVPATAWIDDLVVLRRVRRQGIGTALLLSAQTWASSHDCRRMIVEMQSKNYPAICLVQKLGYDFSGYHERYFGNLDIALFFSKIMT